MELRNLVLVRHGHYYLDRLSDKGRKQAGYMGDVLKARFPDRGFAVVTSTAPRAVETAEIIADRLAMNIGTESECLWSGDGHEIDYQETLDLIRHYGTCQVLVVVTHLPHAKEFPDFFAKHELGIPDARIGGELFNCRGWDIDCKTGECRKIEIPESH